MTPQRRPKGDGSIHQRADGLWVATISAGYKDGKRQRVSVSAKTQAECLKRKRAKERELAAGVTTDATTVAQWMKTYLDTTAAQRVRPRTLDGYRMYTEHWIVPQIGNVRLASLTAAHVRRLDGAMAQAGRAPATRRQVLAILSRALKVAVQERALARNPCDDVDKPGAGDAHHEGLTRDEATRVLEVSRSDARLHARLCLALLAGLRQGEVLALSWANVDLDAGVIHVRQAVTRTKAEGTKIAPPKSTRSVRDVPMVPILREALATWREQAPESPWVFPAAWDLERPIEYRRDHGMWKAALAAAGVPPRPLHGARATTATLLLELGVPVQVAAAILGHADPALTLRVYARSDDSQQQEAMRRLGESLG